MEFIKKEQLEKEYIAFGRFYTLKYDNGVKKCCRSKLEIFERNSCDSLKGSNKIDAVFIMMNPGSGKPTKNYVQQCKNLKQVKAGEVDKIQLVETDPDYTQNQVMRVMRIKKWKYVRIINISDYRNSKCESFYSMLKETMAFDSEFIHSIFFKERKQEIKSVYKSDGEFKVIAAWGVNSKLNKLIKLALKDNKVVGRIGYNKSKFKTEKMNNFYYYHPLPKNPLEQPLWLEQIIKRL